MKRYLVFKFDQYYPAGGMDDLIGQADTLNDAKNIVKAEVERTAYIDEGETWESDSVWNGMLFYAHIYDIHEDRKVWQSRNLLPGT